MSRIIILFALLVALANTVQTQTQIPPIDYQQQQQQQLPLQNQNQLPGMPNMQYQQNGQIPQMQMRPGQNGLLGGLLGGNNNNNNNGGGLFDAIRNIPQRGMEIMNQLLSQVRNMLPGLGRNGNNSLGYNQQMPYQNQMMPLQQGQNTNNGLLPNLNNLASPITDLLQQGRLPNANSLTQGLSNTLNSLTNGRQQPTNTATTLNY